MKSVVVLYESESKYKNEKAFDSLSAKDLCFNKVKSFADENFCDIEKISNNENKDLISLIKSIKKVLEQKNADNAFFLFDDLPFFDKKLSEELLKNHIEYKAEYTYSDGYPYGFTGEVITKGALDILEELLKVNHKDMAENKVTPSSLYELLKTEINSFEVEAVLSDVDYRQLRICLNTEKKENFLECKALYEKLSCVKDDDVKEVGAEDLSKIASVTPSLLKTVPSFYNIQVADFVSSSPIYSPYESEYKKKYNESALSSKKIMDYDKFSLLIDQISSFSDTAVVSLSLWGEAFSNPDILKMIEKVLSYDGLSVYIETDGQFIDEEVCKKISELEKNALPRRNGWDSVMIAVSLDAVTKEKYKKIHIGCADNAFEKAIDAMAKLSSLMPKIVYPQFVRMNENEDETESFFRYWNSTSYGNCMIDKYNDFSGLLPDRKPADLSPLERNPCWHLRRDLSILSNGDVPLCKNYMFSSILGNVFETSVEQVWRELNEKLIEHVNKNYNDKCGKCDEYYTFNF